MKYRMDNLFGTCALISCADWWVFICEKDRLNNSRSIIYMCDTYCLKWFLSVSGFHFIIHKEISLQFIL